MKIYYLDASVWVKRYHYEIGTNWIQSVFFKKQATACATLGFVEVMATLARKYKGRIIDHTIFEQKSLELEEDWRWFIQIELDNEVIDDAKKLARELALRGADAIHLASALVLKRYIAEDGNQLIFAASDHELIGAARKSGLVALDPEKLDNDPQEVKI